MRWSTCLEENSSDYWILDMEKKEKYGPLRKDEYDQKKKELDINLQLIKDKERAAGIPEAFDVE
ncbi:hypothetical protein CEW92_10510 [Bacillaceae bacterium SAS-127]|nr:hypothetical protein CEW92_10510 [Bacillaceae bacterium SAS-127]